MRQIPKKNYIIFLIVIITSVVICIYLTALYNNYKTYKYSISTLSNILREIVPSENMSNIDNLDNYLRENSNIIIYISVLENEETKQFEKEFYDFIVKNKLDKSIVYIDIDNINYKEFMMQLQNHYSKDTIYQDYNNNPTLIIFKNGLISDIYNDNFISVEQVNNLFIRNGVIYND
ncbi:MAG: hypothetical protein NC181_02190 [Clostridium sp.]|nr:hypothetical protein [Clostridium sp.]MCM1443694.1 hypothetical protein [Candidatus Amulumruptor caecigallinarius]